MTQPLLWRGRTIPGAERLVLLLPFVAAMGLALWSTQRLVRVVRDTNAAAHQVGRLSHEVEALEQRQAAAEREGLESRCRDVRSRLIAGESGVREWLHRMTGSADRSGFETRIRLGPAERRLAGEPVVDSVPVVVEFTPRADGAAGRSATARLTELLRETAVYPEWVEFKSLSLSGHGSGVSTATLALQLWVIPPGS